MILMFAGVGILLFGFAFANVHANHVVNRSAGDCPVQPAGASQSIAFQSNRDGNFEVYVMDPDGSILSQTRKTFDLRTDNRPDISPDGRQIVFASNRITATNPTGARTDLFLMNSDGSAIRQLTFDGAMNSWPRWSPTGEWIVFHSNRDSGDFEIYRIRPDGTELTRVTNRPGVDQFPGWSPDSARLSIRRDNELFLIDRDGSNPVRLTFTSTPAFNQMASWSPDGKKLAFLSTREPGNYTSIFLANLDDISNQVNLTPKPDQVATNIWGSRAPAWSRDGNYIYFTGIRPETCPSGPPCNEQIFVMNADGTCVTQLTSAGANAEATVRYALPPTITDVTATPNVLWPPNNQMVPVTLAVDVSDFSDPAPVCRITNVTSNEPAVDADWQVTGLLTLDLRALRLGAHTGREYTITVTCTNSSELSSSAAVTVRVPHDQRK